MRANRRAPVLSAGAVLLGLAWAVGPRGAPPVYDGLVVAAPYRYSCPPAGYQNPGPPLSAQQTYPSSDAQTQGVVLTTGEMDEASGSPSPQAQFLAGPASFGIPQGAPPIALSIRPSCAPSQRPPDGEVVGNLYSFAATTPAGAAVPLSPQHNVNVILRGPPAGSSDLVMELLANGTWSRLDTTPVNTMHTFAAQQVPELGAFALVGQPATSSGGAGSGSGGGLPVAGLVIGGALLVAAAGAVILVAQRRRRPAAPPPGRRRGGGGRRRPPPGRRRR